MSALADRDLIDRNFAGQPSEVHPGMSWVVETAIQRGNEDVIKIKEHLEALIDTSKTNDN